MTRISVRRWFLCLLPVLAACGLSDLLEPDAGSGDGRPVEDFEGLVASVDLVERSFTLVDGTEVNILDATDLEPAPDGLVLALEAAHEALEDGWSVFGWGNGEVAQEAPLVLDGVSVGLRLKDPPSTAFEGHVASVNLDAHSVELVGGTVVRLVDGAERLVAPDGTIYTLEAIHRALEEGRSAFAWGSGEVESEEPLVIEGRRVGLKVLAPRVEEFEGPVASIDLGHSLVTLVSGTVVQVGDHTELVAAENGTVYTLAEAQQALEDDRDVFAWGRGEVTDTEPLVLRGLRLGLNVAPAVEPEPVVEDFEGDVDAVDLSAGSFMLSDGTVVRVVDRTEIVPSEDGTVHTLASVLEAIQDGAVVIAWGVGEVEGASPLTLEGLRVGFEVTSAQAPAVEAFDDLVMSVDMLNGTFTLGGGTVVRFQPNTVVAPFNEFSPTTLAEINDAIESGLVLFAWGLGEVEQDTPLLLGAVELNLEIPFEEFELNVAAVDLGAGLLVLENGWQVFLTDETALSAADGASPSDLFSVNDALLAGDTVSVTGLGLWNGFDPFGVEALSLIFLRIS